MATINFEFHKLGSFRMGVCQPCPVCHRVGILIDDFGTLRVWHKANVTGIYNRRVTFDVTQQCELVEAKQCFL